MSVDASDALLRWYAVDKRRLPWRAGPGERPDPYRVWLSEIMLQQTTVAAATPYFESFVARWPTVERLAAAEEGEIMAAWAGLGYYARARNLVACARQVAGAHGGRFPDEEAGLRALPGIGPYTAAAVAAIAFGRRAVAVDANVERVVARLFAVETPLPAARREIHALAESLVPDGAAGDFAQAMMDLGATICTPKSPRCPGCPLRQRCAAARTGAPASYPRRAPRRARPQRYGLAWWLEHDGHVLLERRPARGMLGGMLGLPTGPWNGRAEAGEPPRDTCWREAGSVRHVFTHFALELALRCAETGRREEGEIWWPIADLDAAGLPTLFSKVARRAAGWRMLAGSGPAT
ncbi:MAG: A/G-specific adenine glycosylase [Sphingomonadaceae bacterium]